METLKQWHVKIPMAGHLAVWVEAESEERAIEKAMEHEFTIDDVVEWQEMEAFWDSGVLYCPHPWTAEATERPWVDVE